MSNTYWQDRMAQAQNDLSNKTTKQVEKQLKKYYAASMQRTIKDFQDTYEKVFIAAGEGKTPTPADLYKLDKYWQMQGQMRKELQKLGDRQIAALSKAFEENFFEVYYSIALEGMEAFNTLDAATVQQLINSIWVADGTTWQQKIWKNTEKLAATLNEELINCVATGKPANELKGILMDRFSVSYSQADTLVTTELAHIQTEAAKKRYQDYGITRVQVWADEDERRCKECGKLHEKYYTLGEHIPIPAHPRCRCCIVPVVD